MTWRSIALSSVALTAAAAPAFAQDAATAPASRPAAASTQPRINLSGPANTFRKLFPKTADIADPAQRAAKGPEAIAAIKPLVAQLDALSPQMRQMNARTRDSFVVVLVALGDAETRAANEALAAGEGPEAAQAANILTRADWILASNDPAKQSEMADAIEAKAKARPDDADYSLMIYSLAGTTESPEMKARLNDLLLTHMDNKTVDAIKAQAAKQDKVKAVEGKPIVISGTTPDGKTFSTAEWKGKVILVDFWAVWCGPCIAELPRVKKVYAEYHDKGFEVLGVSNDYAAKTVIAYAAKNDLPWTQLFDADAAEAGKWNPITTGFGIDGIPVMFLIDKNGVCRTVTARENFEKLIPEMLAE